MSIARTRSSMKLLLILLLFYVSSSNLEICADDGNGVSCSSPPRTNSSEEDEEIYRRSVLVGRTMKKYYISYDTLKKDVVPCERPGASYYNCRSAGVANPYTRGCQVITGCARDLRDINS